MILIKLPSFQDAVVEIMAVALKAKVKQRRLEWQNSHETGCNGGIVTVALWLAQSAHLPSRGASMKR
jgi:hypothetical protein